MIFLVRKLQNFSLCTSIFFPAHQFCLIGGESVRKRLWDSFQSGGWFLLLLFLPSEYIYSVCVCVCGEGGEVKWHGSNLDHRYWETIGKCSALPILLVLAKTYSDLFQLGPFFSLALPDMHWRSSSVNATWVIGRDLAFHCPFWPKKGFSLTF